MVFHLTSIDLQPAAVVGVALLLVALCVWLVYSGLLIRVHVQTREPHHGNLTVAYKSATGPYKEALNIFKECTRLTPRAVLIGLYYDDPDSTDQKDLRFAAGVILAQNDAMPDADELQLLMSHGYKLAYLPKPMFAVTADFPLRTSLSVFLAIQKVYPRLKHYVLSKKLCAYPAIEIYEQRHIHFLMPLSRQEEFYVPEFCDDLESSATTEMSSHEVCLEDVEDTSPGRWSEAKNPPPHRASSDLKKSSKKKSDMKTTRKRSGLKLAADNDVTVAFSADEE